MKFCASNKKIRTKVFSISDVLEQYNDDIPCNKKNKINKMSKNEFAILTYNEYMKLSDYNYNVSQLKQMCKHYKQKLSGNKEQLISRVYNYLKYSYYAIQIQKMWRGKLYRNFEKNQGNILQNKKKFVNDTDFFTLDTIKDIPYYHLFCFMDTKDTKDDNDFIYVCDIVSLYNLIKSKNDVTNPYNRTKISKETIRRVNKHLNLSKILGYKIDVNIKKINIENIERQIEVDTLDLFQTIDNLGNYTEIVWFSELNRAQIIRYIREIHDIWLYRADLTIDTKRDICPPHGNLFYNINFREITLLAFTELQQLSLLIMNRLVKNGINYDSRVLGAYYVLAALTLVDCNAAIALPWLYQSVAYGN
jgi:hypothetical protein